MRTFYCYFAIHFLAGIVYIFYTFMPVVYGIFIAILLHSVTVVVNDIVVTYFNLY